MKNIDAAIRIRYQVLGRHVHCRVFTAPKGGATYAKNGELVFSVEEWSSVQWQLERGGAEVLAEGVIA